MEGDDLLLAEMDAKAAPKRDGWMTTLHPEKNEPGGGVPMHTTITFSKTPKDGRGDTTAWTDTPSERAQKAKMRFKSDEERLPVNHVVAETFPYLLNIFKRLVQTVNPSIEVADLIK
ncbi:hypothetical protein CASFOL_011589 [Castilleja foliolosa]|uniref:Uncharacterized protein n=1 Tax=Castilleja foliolosa TaxID=1961234 RepID=A0ABD3DWX4_9LAMI